MAKSLYNPYGTNRKRTGYYRVVTGDTWQSIAAGTGASPDVIRAANGIVKPLAGMRLKIPAAPVKAVAPTVAGATVAKPKAAAGTVGVTQPVKAAAPVAAAPAAPGAAGKYAFQGGGGEGGEGGTQEPDTLPIDGSKPYKQNSSGDWLYITPDGRYFFWNGSNWEWWDFAASQPSGKSVTESTTSQQPVTTAGGGTTDLGIYGGTSAPGFVASPYVGTPRQVGYLPAAYKTGGRYAGMNPVTAQNPNPAQNLPGGTQPGSRTGAYSNVYRYDPATGHYWMWQTDPYSPNGGYWKDLGTRGLAAPGAWRDPSTGTVYYGWAARRRQEEYEDVRTGRTSPAETTYATPKKLSGKYQWRYVPGRGWIKWEGTHLPRGRPARPGAGTEGGGEGEGGGFEIRGVTAEPMFSAGYVNPYVGVATQPTWAFGYRGPTFPAATGGAAAPTRLTFTPIGLANLRYR